MDGKKHSRGLLAAFAVAVSGLLLISQIAWAGGPDESSPASVAAPSARAAVANVVLHGGNVPKIGIFNPDKISYYDDPAETRPFGGAPCQLLSAGYTPVMDGGIDINGDDSPDQTDAFDGGLYVEINGKVFKAKKGKLSGEQLTTQDRVASFDVTRIDRALPSGPILRSLIVIENPKAKTRTAKITLDSAMGADDSEDTRTSSDGSSTFEKTDRWIVASDDPTTPNDPPIVFVNSGRGAHVHLRNVIWAPEDDSSTFCEGAVVYGYKVRVQPGATVILMHFTELQDTNANAIAAAAKYNKRHLTSALKKGLSRTQKEQIVNFDL